MDEGPELETRDIGGKCLLGLKNPGGVFAPASDAENYTIDSIWRFTQKR